MNEETCSFSSLLDVRKEYHFVAKDLIKNLNLALKGSSFQESRIRVLIERLNKSKSNVAHCDNSIQVLLEEDFILYVNSSFALSTRIEKAISQAESLLDYLSDEILYGKFNGELAEWFRFWEAFDVNIHSREDLSTQLKLSCLKSRLKSWPLELIEKSMKHNCEYKEAIKLLQSKFSNIKLLVETHLNALIDLKPPTATPVSLLQFSSDFQYHVRALKAFRTNIEDASILTTAVLCKKLPKEILDRINKTNKRTYWTLPDFENSLNFEVMTKCSELFEKSDKISSVEIQNSLTDPILKDDKANKILLSEFQSPICYFCLGKHNVEVCTIYETAFEKLERANELQLCLVCYKIDHESENCVKPGCSVCNKKHSQLLCVASEENNKNEKINMSKKKKKKKVKTVCTLCLYNHNSKYCNIYKTAKAKLGRAKRLNLCLLCFSSIHKTEKCRQPNLLCAFCEGRHNLIFCVPGYEERLMKREKVRKLVKTISSDLNSEETPIIDITIEASEYLMYHIHLI